MSQVRLGRCFTVKRRGSDSGRDFNRGALRVAPVAWLTSPFQGPNILLMARPQVVRRIKSYSAASGYVYQYHFYEVRAARHGSADGNEYVYMVSANRKTTFPVSIFVRRDAVRNWAGKTRRELTGTEEYAVAKMRLFQAFDENTELAGEHSELTVDTSNLDSLLAQLDL